MHGGGNLPRWDFSTVRAKGGAPNGLNMDYPVMTADGCIWCANSTDAETWPQALDGRADGFLFVLRPSGEAEIVAANL